jgi:hypothetical protein
MAIVNNRDIADRQYDRQFRNESVSFVSSLGDNASFRTVPKNETWELQTLRAFNGEGAAREMLFLLTDADGTHHATITMSGKIESVDPSRELSWNGSVIVPSGWRIYAKWMGMAGGSSCNWQFTAVTL